MVVDNPDLIHKMPGFSHRLPSKTYGGYVDISDSKHMYYMFVEAETSPSTAPILFWTNGGPGCSGLMGLFEEFGPYRPTKGGKIKYNPWAWTKFANIVFVEQPIGVGFSWSNTKSDLVSNDMLSAKDNLQFVLNFFDKYSSFKKNRMYLISESYGGHYVPTWANEIVKYNKKHKDEIKLKGFMIGNPYVDMLTGSATQIESYWGHQKLPIKSWNKFTKRKCANLEGKKNWRKTWKKNRCSELAYKLEDQVGKHNPYAIDYPICVSKQQNTLINYSRVKNKTVKKRYTPCLDNYTTKYLNRKDVQEAIHARKQRVKWKACSDLVKYRAKDSYISQVPLIDKLLNDKDVKHLDVFIMSGTNDAICGTIGTQRWVTQLNIKPKKEWKQYFVEKEPAGYISTYSANNHKKFIFATVNFAGHEVPMYKPQAAYKLMKKFLNGELR